MLCANCVPYLAQDCYAVETDIVHDQPDSTVTFESFAYNHHVQAQPAPFAAQQTPTKNAAPYGSYVSRKEPHENELAGRAEAAILEGECLASTSEVHSAQNAPDQCQQYAARLAAKIKAGEEGLQQQRQQTTKKVDSFSARGFHSCTDSESPPQSTFSGGSDPGRMLDVLQDQAVWIRETKLENRAFRRDLGLNSDDSSSQADSMSHSYGLDGDTEDEDPRTRHIKIRVAIQEGQLQQLDDAKRLMEWHLHHGTHYLPPDRVNNMAESLRRQEQDLQRKLRHIERAKMKLEWEIHHSLQSTQNSLGQQFIQNSSPKGD